ncbi:MAG: sigma-70 family RNA polymerase sigma factor [Acidimicrobiia bacterium]
MALATNDEQALVLAHRRGDDSAFTEIVQSYTDGLYAHARRRLRDSDLAGDALQETFLRAYRSIDRLGGEMRLGAWLHRICDNVCTDIGNRRRRDDAVVERLGSEPGQVVALFPDLDLSDDVRAALATLPVEHRDTVVLRAVEDLSFRDVAELTGTSETNARARFHRGRRALRHLLDLKSGSLALYALVLRVRFPRSRTGAVVSGTAPAPAPAASAGLAPVASSAPVTALPGSLPATLVPISSTPAALPTVTFIEAAAVTADKVPALTKMAAALVGSMPLAAGVPAAVMPPPAPPAVEVVVASPSEFAAAASLAPSADTAAAPGAVGALTAGAIPSGTDADKARSVDAPSTLDLTLVPGRTGATGDPSGPSSGTTVPTGSPLDASSSPDGFDAEDATAGPDVTGPADGSATAGDEGPAGPVSSGGTGTTGPDDGSGADPVAPGGAPAADWADGATVRGEVRATELNDGWTSLNGMVAVYVDGERAQAVEAQCAYSSVSGAGGCRLLFEDGTVIAVTIDPDGAAGEIPATLTGGYTVEQSDDAAIGDAGTAVVVLEDGGEPGLVLLAVTLYPEA